MHVGALGPSARERTKPSRSCESKSNHRHMRCLRLSLTVVSGELDCKLDLDSPESVCPKYKYEHRHIYMHTYFESGVHTVHCALHVRVLEGPGRQRVLHKMPTASLTTSESTQTVTQSKPSRESKRNVKAKSLSNTPHIVSPAHQQLNSRPLQVFYQLYKQEQSSPHTQHMLDGGRSGTDQSNAREAGRIDKVEGEEALGVERLGAQQSQRHVLSYFLHTMRGEKRERK